MKPRQIHTTVLRVALLLTWIASAGLSGCRSEEQPPNTTQVTSTIQITSTAFEQGQPIPKKYSGDGENVSPPLAWSGLPEGTKELALICDDPDAPRADPWVHWVVYKIPATVKRLPEDFGGADTREKALAAVLEGRNSFDATGYGGPMPPPGHGRHRYNFKLYALDVPLQLESDVPKELLLQAMESHVLAEGQLMGTYER